MRVVCSHAKFIGANSSANMRWGRGVVFDENNQVLSYTPVANEERYDPVLINYSGFQLHTTSFLI